MDRALTFGPALVDPNSHARLIVERPGIGIAKTPVHEEELAVRCFEFRPGAYETMPDACRECQDAPSGKSIFDDLASKSQSLGILVQCDPLVDPPIQASGEVVPIVLAYTW